jgi:hypothetical protein
MLYQRGRVIADVGAFLKASPDPAFSNSAVLATTRRQVGETGR